MSERKSWDIAPRPRKAAATHAQASQARGSGARSVTPVDMVRTPRASASRAASRTRATGTLRTSTARPPVRTTRSEAAPAGRLRERRQKARKAARVLMLGVAVIVIIGSLYALWLPQLRVQEVAASGANADAIVALTQSELRGTYAFIVPKNSILFFPQEPIREAVLSQFPEVADVAITRSSFTSLEVTATPRAKAFVWCGTSFGTPFSEGRCFEADGEGLVFRASESTATSMAQSDDSSISSPSVRAVPSSELGGELKVYGPLDTELAEGEWPIGLRVSKASSMPDVLRLVDAIKTLNVPIVAITLRDDEADLWVNDATRLTYVVGREQSAASLAASVIPTLDLTDGTIQYLDLRFNGKAYLKRYGE